MAVTVHVGVLNQQMVRWDLSWDLELNECYIQDCYVKMLTHAVSFADTDSYKQV